MNVVVGRLSTKGWAKTNREKMTQVLENYSNCAFSQSTIYAGHIRSWAYAQKRGIGDPATLETLAQEDLTILYNDVFSNGEVDVVVEHEYEEENSSIYHLNISINVRVDGESLDLYDALRTTT